MSIPQRIKSKGFFHFLLRFALFIFSESANFALFLLTRRCKSVLDEYSVKYCILFGSYAKGTETEKSDVDLLISTDVTGLRFYGIAERLRTALRKKVDLLDLKQLEGNTALLDEILKEGIKVYQQSEG